MDDAFLFFNLVAGIATLFLLAVAFLSGRFRTPAYRNFFKLFIVFIALFTASEAFNYFHLGAIRGIIEIAAAGVFTFAVYTHARLVYRPSSDSGKE
jgi:hypothetical protein